ncbi:MAG: formate dehydrogenase subunit gamma, partial [Desulfobulbia bacterium]
NFATMTFYGKWIHDHVAFAFMLSLVLILVVWIRHNFPNRHDFIWLLKGGGLFMKGSHPPARKFNAGQKILFWLVILGGASLSLSGIALLFPFQTSLFAKTFEFLNIFGLNLPTDLTPVAEMQLATLWHSVVALVLICVVVAHIYIGTLGMEGAFDAMGSGEVDQNWAKEHHSVWCAEELDRRKKEYDSTQDDVVKPQPAE